MCPDGTRAFFAGGSPEFRLVTGIRDEAHHFAISYHRKLREKRHHTGELDKIEGIGQTRKRGAFKGVRQREERQGGDVRG